MQDLRPMLEKLLVEAENCDLIAKLAATLAKRELFKKLAADLRSSAREMELLLASQTEGGRNPLGGADQTGAMTASDATHAAQK